MRSLLVISLVLFCGCTRVGPGYVGIKVNQYGTQKGVEDYPIQTGRVWYNPFTEDIYVYPTFMQNRKWESEEGIQFNSIEGAIIKANVAINFSMNAEKVPNTFVKFRKDIEQVIETYLHNEVRDAFNEAGGKLKSVELFGERKAELEKEVNRLLTERVSEYGFEDIRVSIVGSLSADAQVMQSINQVITATQKAIEAENKVKQIEAEAKQEVAKAEGKALAILAEAKAQAEANKVITESLTPELVKYKMIEKWNGTAPMVMGGEPNFMMNLGVK